MKDNTYVYIFKSISFYESQTLSFSNITVLHLNLFIQMNYLAIKMFYLYTIKINKEYSTYLMFVFDKKKKKTIPEK